MEEIMRSRSVTLLPLIALAACGASVDDSAPTPTPPALAVPAGHELVVSYHAVGYQVYDCKPDAAGAPAWTFHAPVAMLYAADDTLAAVHYGGVDVGLPAGPYWQSARDASRVHGGNPVSSANPGAIPLLRLQGMDHAGAGQLSEVTFIQRLATTGGTAPTGPCALEQRTAVPYTADYHFYAPTGE
jgi:hypothetical protein